MGCLIRLMIIRGGDAGGFACGWQTVPRVIADYSKKETITPASLFGVGYQYSVPLDKWNLTDQACDFLYTGDQVLDFEIPARWGSS